jgi:hypothetical protein
MHDVALPLYYFSFLFHLGLCRCAETRKSVWIHFFKLNRPNFLELSLSFPWKSKAPTLTEIKARLVLRLSLLFVVLALLACSLGHAVLFTTSYLWHAFIHYNIYNRSQSTTTKFIKSPSALPLFARPTLISTLPERPPPLLSLPPFLEVLSTAKRSVDCVLFVVTVIAGVSTSS